MKKVKLAHMPNLTQIFENNSLGISKESGVNGTGGH
jgi:hypothetical protein